MTTSITIVQNATLLKPWVAFLDQRTRIKPVALNEKIRKPAVAGMFYPADKSELAQTIGALLKASAGTNAQPKAIIAPHAGYIYSGPTAAAAYALLAKNSTIKRVVLLGPSHRVGFLGIATTSADFYETPLGKIKLDRKTLDDLAGFPFVKILNQAHTPEHSLEVHLPFLQTTLGDFELVPLVVGDAEPRDVALVLNKVWGGAETLIVVSSDLSHYHDYKTAKTLDDATRRHIENLDETLEGEEACGCRPVNGLLRLARDKNLTVKTLDVRNSGDTAGTKDQVVGYGAWAFYERTA